MLQKGIDFAIAAHNGKTRHSTGEDVVEHSIRVAMRMGKLGYNDADQTKAVLHKVLGYTSVSCKDLEKEFGKQISESVYYLTDPSWFDNERDYKGIRALRRYGQHIQFAGEVVHSIKLCSLLETIPVVAVLAPRKTALGYIIDKKLFIRFLHSGLPELLVKTRSELDHYEDKFTRINEYV